MSQPDVFTGVDGELLIGHTSQPFHSYRWLAATASVPQWTAASSPFPDVLPTRQLPLSLQVRGFWAADDEPPDLSKGSEVQNVELRVDSDIVATAPYAIVLSLQTDVSADGASSFDIVLTASWKYTNFVNNAPPSR